MEKCVHNIPIPALVPETGEYIQLHFCRNPACPNFHIDALYQNAAGNWQIARNYSVKTETKPKTYQLPGAKNYNDDDVILKTPTLELYCKLCHSTLTIISNQGVAATAGRLLSQKLPFNFCPTKGCRNSNGLHQNDSTAPRYQKFGRTSAGTPRFKCVYCGKVSSPVSRLPRDHKDISENALIWASRFHAVSSMGVQDYRRHFDADLQREGKSYDGQGYYSHLNRYEYMASLWIKAVNKAIATGKVNILDAGEVESYDYPFVQVQTDLFGLSVSTAGEADKRAEINLILSVLKPSNLILLTSIDFDAEADIPEMLNEQLSTNQDIYREFIPNAQFLHAGDHVRSPDGKDGRKNPAVFAQGVKIRKNYALHSHFYALNQLLAKVKPVVHCMDNEIGLANACIWAFRKKIAAGDCHIITLKRAGYGDKAPEKEVKAKNTKDRLTAQFKDKTMSPKEMEYQKLLERTADFREQYFTAVSKKGVANARRAQKNSAITSDLFSKTEGLKELAYRSDNGQIQDEELAQILQAATLLNNDSVMQQMRQRVPGAFRGKRPAHPHGLSYIGHFQNPQALYQLINIFAFSKNCLSEHSKAKNKKGEHYIPPAVKLGIIQPEQRIQDFCRQNLNSIIEQLYET